MIKPELHSTVIFRIPRFSYIDNLENNWNDLKEAIKISSSDFYELIAEMSYDDFHKAAPRIQQTVRKYYNRAALRSTPYGVFSGVGIAIMDFNHNGLKVSDDLIVHSFEDWQSKPDLVYNIKRLSRLNATLFTNSTFYRVGDEIRFIQRSENGYEIAAIDYEENVFLVLGICTVPRSISFIKDQLPMEEKLLSKLLQSLIELQLLFTSIHPNIIGEDYFRRINHHPKESNKKYLIAERKCEKGQLDKKLFKHLPELVNKMQQILEVNQSTALNDFKDKFSNKFELAEVPIMLAIDPEAGVGYGGLESVQNDLFQDLLRNEKRSHLKNATASELKDILYQKIQQRSIGNQTIELNELIASEKEIQPIPNSVHALFTVVDERLFLDSLGGATAISLSARFASAIPEIHEHCKEINNLEQQSNPDVLFFDIGYTKEDHVDNINRRPSIYDYQFNILNFDTTTAPLTANDIMLSIHKDTVMLRSKTLNKRIIPRFTSSYNYGRSDLPIFRLLMDIQNQGIHSNLILRPRMIIPNLHYYPRIAHRNIVISPATWLIESSIIKDSDSVDKKCLALFAYLRSILYCARIKTGSGDQTLLLDTNNETDLLMLLALLEKENRLYVEEAELPKSPIVVNSKGLPFLPQIAVTLFHKSKIYRDLPFPINQGFSMEKKQWVPPGKEWLYFEIYGKPLRLDEILVQKISTFLKSNRQHLKMWFFIRYNLPSDHIRLRLKMRNSELGYSIISKLSDLLNKDLEEGIVSDFQLRTYKKEVHRYSPQIMEKVESHFYRDSQYALFLLQSVQTNYSKYHLCIKILDRILESGAVTTQEINAIVNNLSDSLKVEHNINSEGLKKINQKFREYINADLPILTKQAVKLYQTMLESFLNTLNDCPESFRKNMMANLMHMHINRIFTSNQRLHEMMIYEFYKMTTKRKNSIQNH